MSVIPDTTLSAKVLRETPSYIAYRGVLGEREIDFYIPKEDFRNLHRPVPTEVTIYCNSRRIKNQQVKDLEARNKALSENVCKLLEENKKLNNKLSDVRNRAIFAINQAL